mmetsp:Transcript_38378/g.79795  ORF Transcript_38378/g.79795 Transcript_38378/m.79795 type:complete len:87 (+) Transcript_38378:12-272(+)
MPNYKTIPIQYRTYDSPSLISETRSRTLCCSEAKLPASISERTCLAKDFSLTTSSSVKCRGFLSKVHTVPMFTSPSGDGIESGTPG